MRKRRAGSICGPPSAIPINQVATGLIGLLFATASATTKVAPTRAEGHLPKGAIVGRNGFGKVDYEICPPEPGETYVFVVYALPRALSPHKDFDARELPKKCSASQATSACSQPPYAR